MLVFFPGGDAAPNMALRFVDIQHLPHLSVQLGIDFFQPIDHVLVHRGFADMKLTRCCARRGVVLHNIGAQLDGSFFHSPFQCDPPSLRVLDTEYERAGAFMMRFCVQKRLFQNLPVAGGVLQNHQGIGSGDLMGSVPVDIGTRQLVVRQMYHLGRVL